MRTPRSAACPVGAWATGLGNSDCTPCPGGATTLGTGSTSAAACFCSLGYGSADAATCYACPFGFYKDTFDYVNCTACPDNTNTTAPGATALTQCTCMLGYSGADGGPCSGAWRRSLPEGGPPGPCLGPEGV